MSDKITVELNDEQWHGILAAINAIEELAGEDYETDAYWEIHRALPLVAELGFLTPEHTRLVEAVRKETLETYRLVKGRVEEKPATKAQLAALARDGEPK